MDFAELRRKAEAAAAGLRPHSHAVRYEPARPALDGSSSSDLLPSLKQRADNSPVLQHHAQKSPVPPPPRRIAAPPAPPPPPRAAKPASLSPISPAAPRSTSRPIPAPPYSHAVGHDLPSPSSSTRPTFTSSQPVDTPQPYTCKRFSEYGDQDKRDLFAALDSFFDARLQVTTTAYTGNVDVDARSDEPAMPAEPAQAAAPPPVARSTRPRLAATRSDPAPYAPTPKPPELHAPSYPPPASHSSAALSLAHYLLDTPFTTAWFASPTSGRSPLPPPLIGRSDVRFTASWAQHGPHKTHVGAALFGDGSLAWWRLEWDAAAESASRAHLACTRDARYRPRPDPAQWDAHALYAASEQYGPALVRFAEAAVARRQPVARGECWDLASEALEAAAAAARGGERPFPSIGRTHGALLYYARAGAAGTWTGGDAYVRPGDVVEWRGVRISEAGAADGAYMVLGDPDHTAIVLSADVPASPPSLPPSPPFVDASYPPLRLGTLTVAEQSLGQAPTVRTYDLATLTAGELWIYRPCAMRALCGVDELEAVWPEERAIECWSVGELE